MSAAKVLGGKGLRVRVFGASRAGAVPAAGAEPSSAKSLREDGTWSSSGGGGSGDVVGPSSSVASEVALFDGNTGKLIKRATGTGLAKLTSGVLSAVTTWAGAGLTGTASRLASFDGSGNPTDTTLAAAMEALSSTQGAVLYRNASAWVALAAGTAGQRLRTGGSGADPAWADLLGFYGDGSNEALNFDGSSTVLGMAPASGVYTLTREIYATDLTIGSGVRIAAGSYGIWANGTLTFTDATSIISGNGKDATSFPGGASQTTQAPYGFGGSGGGGGRTSTSGSGSSGSYAATSPCGAGGAGGLASGGNGGGAGGNASAAAANRGGSRALDWVIRRCKYLDNTAFVLNGGGAGGGGGGLTHSTGTGSGGGGGGGARGAVVWARLVVGAGIIEAAGGAGANGVSTGADLAGGGGGGGGGCAILITTTPAPPCTVRAPGGAPGNGSGGGVAGSAGSDGLVLTFIL